MFYLQYCAFVSTTRKYNCIFTRRILNNKQYKYRKTTPFLQKYCSQGNVILCCQILCFARIWDRRVHLWQSPAPTHPFHPSSSSHHQHIRLGLRMSDLWQINGFCFIKPTNRFNNVSSTSIFCFKLWNVPFYFYDTMN